MKNNKAYPVIRLKPDALDDLPKNLADEFRSAPALYKQAEPNIRGMVFIGTSPTASGGLSTFVHESAIEKA